MPPADGHAQGWSGERAAQHLRSLELFGMRFGLDRMRRMMTALGSPERDFQAIHVVGTNGKTSTARMIAAILQRHGLRTGTYTSPHMVSYSERVQIEEREIPEGAFAAAVARAAWAAERVNRTLAQDDHVTQFELLTAAAFAELARQGVQVAVIEAGLGARYDATSVADFELTALTNVGLEHTRWLGPTVRDIAEEKLAALAPGATLALGLHLREDALAVARRIAAERDAPIVQVREPWHGQLHAAGEFQRANFALARVAAAAYLRSAGIQPSAEAVQQAATQTRTPGRLHVLGSEPLTLVDGAHNPDAVRALAQSLPALIGERPLALVLGVLEDKDAAGMLRTLLPLCARAWFTAPPSPRALSPAALQSLARQQGFEEVVCEPNPCTALAQARAWATGQGAAGGRAGGVLATGSIYLVGELLREQGGAERDEQRGSGRDEQRGAERDEQRGSERARSAAG
jgi:dihydrofolate synthase/folylpolyglutamate synthase